MERYKVGKMSREKMVTGSAILNRWNWKSIPEKMTFEQTLERGLGMSNVCILEKSAAGRGNKCKVRAEVRRHNHHGERMQHFGEGLFLISGV